MDDPGYQAGLVDLLGLTIIIPLLSLYAATFKADALTIGLLAASYRFPPSDIPIT